MKKGTLVEIEFLDHAQGPKREEGYAPVECRVVGWVFEDNPTFVTLAAWVNVELDDPGTDYITVVKHPGMKIKRLGRKLS